MPYQRITRNIATTGKRYATLNGKQYLVLPAVMLTPGVHEGNKGKLLYLPEELSKFPMVWNHKPVEIEHPDDTVETGSGCETAVIEKQGCGILFNSAFDGRLKTESWTDEDRLRVLAPEVAEKIDRGEMIEVSTGLYHEIEHKHGEYNGEPYVGIVRNIQPDHLAILTKGKGACSIEKGAGLLRNADGGELSYDDAREQIRSLLKPPEPASSVGPYDYVYVCDVFPKYAVYETGGKTYKVGYKVKDGKVSLSGEPEEVRRVTSYVTANGEKVTSPYATWREGEKILRLPYAEEGGKIRFIGNPLTQEPDMATPANKPTTNTLDPAAARKEVVDQLIAKHGWAEADRTFLAGIPDDQFNKISAVVRTPPSAASQIAQIAGVPLVTTLPPEPVQQITQAVQNADPVEAYLEQLPRGVRDFVREAIADGKQRKQELIARITANKACQFNPAWLEQQGLPMLRGLAALAGGTPPASRPTANYSGQGEVPMFLPGTTTSPTANAADEQMALPFPGMQFEKDVS